MGTCNEVSSRKTRFRVEVFLPSKFGVQGSSLEKTLLPSYFVNLLAVKNVDHVVAHVNNALVVGRKNKGCL